MFIMLLFQVHSCVLPSSSGLLLLFPLPLLLMLCFLGLVWASLDYRSSVPLTLRVARNQGNLKVKWSPGDRNDKLVMAECRQKGIFSSSWISAMRTTISKMNKHRVHRPSEYQTDNGPGQCDFKGVGNILRNISFYVNSQHFIDTVQEFHGCECP